MLCAHLFTFEELVGILRICKLTLGLIKLVFEKKMAVVMGRVVETS